MKIVSWDTETALIAPGLLAPPISCMTWQCARLEEGLLYDLETPSILHWPDAYRPLGEWLESDCMMVGQNIAFDMGVICAQWPDFIPLVFAKYERDQVTDTMIRGQLLDIAAGLYAGWPDATGKWIKPKYNLLDLARRYTSRFLNKDGWRMFYGEFRDVPLDRWIEHARQLQVSHRPLLGLAEHALLLDPKDADKKQRVRDLKEMITSDPQRVIDYPIEDAVATLEVFATQEAHAAYIPVQFEEARAGWQAHLRSAWGLMTDAKAVDALRVAAERAHADIRDRLIAKGLVRANGQRYLAAAHEQMKTAMYAKGEAPRLTDKGAVCLDADACEASDDPVMKDYGLLGSFGSVLAKDIPMLLAGTVTPVQSRIGRAATLRETSSAPNIQNLRSMTMKSEEGDLCIRETFTARWMTFFLDADYPALELHTLGQSCIDLFGFSRLAEMINSGIDPHLAFAAKLANLSYDEAKVRYDAGDEEIKHLRKIAKVFNFGKPGGMGDKKFVTYLAMQGIILELDTVKGYTRLWKQTFPEVEELFGMASRECAGGVGTVTLPRSKFIRGGCNYTAWCNTWFQGPGANVTKRATWKVSRACYVERSSPLFGSRIVNVVHDQIITETPEALVHEASVELGRLMAEGANEFVPDCPFQPIEVVAMKKWTKSAKPVFVDGRLVPWVG